MICNATPLICLGKIGKLELLKKLFGSVNITNAVKEEVLIEEKEGFISIANAIREGWIKIIDSKKDSYLGLGKGENSSINLAKEKNDKLIIDDYLAIKVANEFNIETIRTTSLILMAFRKNFMTKKEVISIINKIIENGYYISPKHYAALLSKLSS